jgi:hypothetical protein
MKKNLIIITYLVIAGTTSAQSIETIFKNGGPKIKGAFGAVTQKFSSIDKEFAYFLGGYGGVLLEKDVLIGAGAFTFLNGNSMNQNGNQKPHLNLTYVGFVAEKIFQSKKAIHFSSNVLLGAAFIGEQNKLPNSEMYSISTRESFVAEPSISVELNATKWFRIESGISYRWLANEPKYSAPAASISLKFGKF